MFWLPKELIDYIWSFDDNIINKTFFNNCIKEFQFLRARRHTISWFSIQHYKHYIYMNCKLSSYQGTSLKIKPEFSEISKYMIEWKNRFGNSVSLDAINFHKPSIVIQNQKLIQ